MKINFMIRPSKVKKDGTCTLEAVVSVKGQRQTIFLERSVHPKQWNQKKQRSKQQEINDYLDSVITRLYNIETTLIRDNNLSLYTLIDMYRNGDRRNATLWDICNLFLREYEKKVKVGEIVKPTLIKYQTILGYVARYLKSINRSDILITDVNQSFCEGLKVYMLGHLTNNTTFKYIKMFKKVLNFAVDSGYLIRNPCMVKMKREKLEYHPLTIEQINAIRSKAIQNDRLSKVRDLFVFQCYTGMAYIDMATLSRNDIKDDKIIKYRQKTNVKSIIPLFDVTKEILQRYDYTLPVLSNQKYNSYLKELGDVCNIPQSLHSHLARHTMATIMLNNGISLPSIAKTLGHSNTRITEDIYAEMLDKTVVEEVMNLNKIL
jgi:site-specific recombinase XerD